MFVFPLLFYFQRREFVRYSKVFPLATWFEVKIPSKWYRRIFGSLEILCGFLMAIIPKRKQNTHLS